MDSFLENARKLYTEHPFGHLNYTRRRHKDHPLLSNLLNMARESDQLYDIGCGRGFYFEQYLNSGLPKTNIHGVDFSSTAVAELKEKGFDVTLGNVMALDLHDFVSDLTVSNGVIHHTPDSFKAFKELVRITKPGGHILLSVYNVWHPYFYIVHKATFPLRRIYWNHTRSIFNVGFSLFKIAFQPLIFLFTGKLMTQETARVLFMDQVMTPRAELFSKAKIRRYITECNCEVEDFKYYKYYLLLSAIIRVPDRPVNSQLVLE